MSKLFTLKCRVWFYALLYCWCIIFCITCTEKQSKVSNSKSKEPTAWRDSLVAHGIKKDFEGVQQWSKKFDWADISLDSISMKAVKYTIRGFTFTHKYDEGIKWIQANQYQLDTLIYHPISKELYFILGEFYDFADRPFIAIDYYHKYIQAYQQFNLLDEKTIRLAHNYLGLCYFIVGNLRLASDCFTQEMEWTKKIFGPESDQLASNLNNMSVIKRHLNDTLASRKSIEKALALRIKIGIKDKNRLGNLYQNLSKAQLLSGQKSQAMNSIKKAINLRNNAPEKDSTGLSSDYFALALVQEALDRPDQAKINLKKALFLSENALGKEDDGTVDCFEKLAELYLKTNQLDTANYYIEEVFKSQKYLSQDTLVESWKNSQRILYALHLQNKILNLKNKDILKIKDNLRQILRILGKTMDQYYTISAISEITKKNLTIIQECVSMSVDLYRKTKDPVYFEYTFNFIENAKALELLVKTLNNFNRLQNVPKDIAQQEYEMNIAINRTKELFHASAPNTSIKDSLFKVLSQQNNQLQILQRRIATNYLRGPLKERNQYFDLASIRQEATKHKATIVHIFSTPSQYYILGIDDSNTPITNTFARDSVDKLIHIWRKSIEDSGIRGIAVEGNFSQPYLLHKILFPSKNPTTRSLIIFPSNAWFLVPFDALNLQLNLNPSGYYIHKYTIQLGYSLSQHKLLSSEPQKISSPSIFAMAPSAKETSQLTYVGESLQFSKLANSQREIDALIDIFGSEAIKNTSKNIDLIGNKLTILHLAAHAKAFKNDPESSFLLLKNDKNEFYPLKAKDIYNKIIPSELTVLSACETGTGSMDQVEGCLSLSRAFFFAGSKSVASSLWQINDAQSAKLIETFYRHLRAGMNKYEALRQAKLDYISDARVMHKSPYYWASLSLYGDGAAIAGPSRSKAWIWLFAIGGFAILTLILWRLFKQLSQE